MLKNWVYMVYKKSMNGFLANEKMESILNKNQIYP